MSCYYIYIIKNKINDKSYIGQKLLKELKTKTITPLNDGYFGSGKYITRAEKKYGIENFEKDILAICHDSNSANILEIEYIKLYKEIGKAEYNIAEGGHADSRKFLSDEEKEKLQNKITKAINSPEVKKRMSESHKGLKPWNCGRCMSDESKRKLSENLRKLNCSEKSKKGWETRRKNGKDHLSENHKKALLNSHLGKKQSEESISKRVSKLKGKKRTEEQRYKMSLAQQKRQLEKPLSNEARLKISKALKGRPSLMKGKHISEETRKKISLAQKGEKNGFYNKHHSEETKRKLSEIGKRRIVSEETRKKISEGIKKYKQKQREKILSL